MSIISTRLFSTLKILQSNFDSVHIHFSCKCGHVVSASAAGGSKQSQVYCYGLNLGAAAASVTWRQVSNSRWLLNCYEVGHVFLVTVSACFYWLLFKLITVQIRAGKCAWGVLSLLGGENGHKMVKFDLKISLFAFECGFWTLVN